MIPTIRRSAPRARAYSPITGTRAWLSRLPATVANRAFVRSRTSPPTAVGPKLSRRARSRAEHPRRVPPQEAVAHGGGQGEVPEPLQVLPHPRHPRPRPVRAEEELLRDLGQPGEVPEDMLRRDAGEVDPHVLVAAGEEERGVAPQRPPAMGEDDLEIGEVHRHVVDEHRVAEARARPREDARPGVEHDGNLMPLRSGVDLPEAAVAVRIHVGVRGEPLVRRGHLPPRELPLPEEAFSLAAG